MTNLLTKIAIGTVALFFVAIVVSASILTANRRADASSATRASAPVEEQVEVASKPKRTFVHRSSLALEKPEEVENINFYGGRMTISDDRFSTKRAMLKAEEGAIQFIER
ncbi:MAG: hypothetical protein MI757_12565 [Pirellulales bacterium]|nr:hypothetical protein [Pirellulales bacterium]